MLYITSPQATHARCARHVSSCYGKVWRKDTKSKPTYRNLQNPRFSAKTSIRNLSLLLFYKSVNGKITKFIKLELLGPWSDNRFTNLYSLCAVLRLLRPITKLICGPKFKSYISYISSLYNWNILKAYMKWWLLKYWRQASKDIKPRSTLECMWQEPGTPCLSAVVGRRFI